MHKYHAKNSSLLIVEECHNLYQDKYTVQSLQAVYYIQQSEKIGTARDTSVLTFSLKTHR